MQTQHLDASTRKLAVKHEEISLVMGDEDITRIFLKFTRHDFDRNAPFLHTLQAGKETVARYIFSEADVFRIPEHEFNDFYNMSTAATGALCKFLANCFRANRDCAGIDVEALLDDSISEGHVDAIEVLLVGWLMIEDPRFILMNAILKGQPGVVALILNWMEITGNELDSEFDQVLRLAFTEGRLSCFQSLLVVLRCQEDAALAIGLGVDFLRRRAVRRYNWH